MGFFSGIRRRIKKLIPKEIRPAIPFLAAAVPGMAALGPIASPFAKAALARIATDDEADVKDAVRAGIIAAAPAAISKGVTSAAGGSMGEGIANILNKGRAVGDTGKTISLARSIEGALNPDALTMGQAKLIGSQAVTDFGIKQAELNEKALEEYNAGLLSRGVRDKAERRSAIFNVFKNAGYAEDEVNDMLDKYGYADGGRVKYANGELVDMDDVILASMKGKKRTGKKTYLDEEGGDKSMTTLEEIAENARDKKDLEDEGFDASEFSENLQAGISGLEKAFGQPLGGRRPEPMRIIPGFASGGDVDEVMEFDEEIITPEYLMKEEGVEIGEQVSNPNTMDDLNQLSLDMFGKPVFELSEDEFEMLKDFTSQQALKPGLIDEYRNYKYQMEEQGITPMSPRDYFRSEFGAARLGVAKGGPIKTQKPDMEKDTKGKMAGPDYVIKRMEDLLDLGYDYDTAGRIAMDEDLYREAMDKGPVGDYKKGGKVIKIMPQGVLYKGKAKDYPGIKQLIKDMKKKGTRNKKADGGVTYSFEDYLKEREMLDKKGTMERLKKEYKEDMRRKKVRKQRTEVKEGGLMSMGGNELDLRGGGFVPMGKKERADDVPARLSKNEFVMTADAVRAAGGGSVQKGADLMYDTMKKLEAQS